MTKNTKSVTQTTTTGTFIGAFKSVAVAEQLTGVDNSDIVKTAKGKRGSAGGTLWNYRMSPLRRSTGRFLVYDTNDTLVATTNQLPLLSDIERMVLAQSGQVYVDQFSIVAV